MASSRWRYLPWCRSSPTLARDTTASLSRGALALAKAVACGDGFIVVVIEHGGLWAVGLGSESQLGLGKDAHQLLPVRMGGGLTRPSPWWRLERDGDLRWSLSDESETNERRVHSIQRVAIVRQETGDRELIDVENPSATLMHTHVPPATSTCVLRSKRGGGGGQ